MSTGGRKLDALSIVLPRGTRVTLRATISGAQGPVAAGTAAVVTESNGRRYTVETLSKQLLDVSRDQIAPKSNAVLERLGDEQQAFAANRDRVELVAVVGSQAWNLANADSDEDRRGAFTLAFEDSASLFVAPDEIHHPSGDESYWEIEKFLRQALRADPNTLETLWSPMVTFASPVGQRLIDEREAFTSRLVIGAFGRYAQGQAKKLEGSVTRARATHALLDAIEEGRAKSRDDAEKTVAEVAASRQTSLALADLLRSFRDRGLLTTAEWEKLLAMVQAHGTASLRPPPVRPKNAYNLIRLLHSCLHWMDHHAPLMATSGAVREELLAIKEGRQEMDVVVERARDLGRLIEDRAPSTTLPEAPNHDAANAILLEARRQAASVSLAGSAKVSTARVSAATMERACCDTPMPDDIDTDAVRAFFAQYEREGERSLPLLWVALTGAHAYGFPSPDSDLDLKAVHAVSAAAALARKPATQPVETIEMFRGREFDLSSHDIAQVVDLLEKGNGNMLERLLGPFSVVTTPLGEELAALAQESVSTRAYRHYRGFFGGSVREYQREDESGARSVKRLLYAYRVALTGTHLLRSGDLVTDVRPLAREYGFPLVERWIERKSEAEGARLARAEQAHVGDDLARLEAGLDAARAQSVLPDVAANIRDLDAFVVRARRVADAWETGQ